MPATGRPGCAAARVGQAATVTDYELVIHLRESTEPTRVRMPGVDEADAEADRQELLYSIREARLAEAPVVALQTRHGFPEEALAVDPHDVTEIDLAEAGEA
jgi:hypothetical protein